MRRPAEAQAVFDREKALSELFFSCDIPAKNHRILCAAVLLLCDEPELTPEKVCAVLAQQMCKSPKFLRMRLAQAVVSGWECAATPSSPLYHRRMKWADYLLYAAEWLLAKEAVSARERLCGTKQPPDQF
ncbi:MAG: hypothetical protein IKQ91_08720 [Oscillospiraceae bacterium]|nr:hypothetical protein [Oscillospiraceae bacterium]